MHWGRSSWVGTLFVDGDVHFPRSYIRFGSRKPIAEGTMTVESERPHPRRTSPSTKSVPTHEERPHPRETSPSTGYVPTMPCSLRSYISKASLHDFVPQSGCLPKACEPQNLRTQTHHCYILLTQVSLFQCNL